MGFKYDGIPIFTPHRPYDLTPLGLSCFTLIPFSNRIKNGGFNFHGQFYPIPPNFTLADKVNPIHGYGLTAKWQIIEQDEHRVQLTLRHEKGDWPWDFRAIQIYELLPHGFRHEIIIQNMNDTPMPAGIGYHPYFPNKDARLVHGFDGFVSENSMGVADTWSAQSDPINLQSAQTIDCDFTGMNGPLKIIWPTHQVELTPSSNLPITHIYIPAGEDYFCIEPVSHVTDAFNNGGGQTILPQESWNVSLSYHVIK
ncbi:hypothetical protein LPB140_03575 [Sphingorhabdus lutea]|uniref:Aldose 1-epimerase n=2 Tax=Sphingorhabdus lutea TaxID=1913578 RepID=A0A1L3JA82_9SPHN|nr:hypothetical protein LPB140_03575 [Sphingorhabdus lutea]